MKDEGAESKGAESKEAESKEQEVKEKPVRKRKWGSSKSTSNTAPAPKRLSSINISTDSLKVH